MSVNERINEMLDNNKIVLFMKGTPDFPQCGFSAKAVAILRALNQDDFHAVNILEDDEMRQGIKDYSDWPTIPQLYIDKQFVGGSDIMQEAYDNGELVKLVG